MGRRHELAEARRLLSSARLVSLVGPGGVGKTRLAVRLADDLSRGFGQGGWWVSLAELRDPDLVSAAVSTALEVPDPGSTEPQRLVLAHLRDSELLLVLDNCEHVVASAAALVDEVLRAAPSVRVIVTSREPLQVPGEHILPVPPLALPPPGGGPSPAQLRQNEAVMLFAERALAASGTFALTETNQATVAELCRRLGRAAAGPRARRRPDPRPHRRSDPGPAVGSVRFAHRRRPRGAAAAADAADGHRLESRPADRGRAAAAAPTLPVRRPVHLGRRRGRVRLGGRRPRPGPAVVVGRQVAGGQGGRRRRRVLPAARVDAGVRRRQVERRRRGRRGGPPFRGALPGPVPRHRRRRLAPPARLAGVGGTGDRQPAPRPPPVRGRRRLVAWARHRDGAGAVLVHPRHPGMPAVARRPDGGGRRFQRSARSGVSDPRLVRHAPGRRRGRPAVAGLGGGRGSQVGRPCPADPGPGHRLDRGEHGGRPDRRRTVAR